MAHFELQNPKNYAKGTFEQQYSYTKGPDIVYFPVKEILYRI